jgi:hypothetical protein
VLPYTECSRRDEVPGFFEGDCSGSHQLPCNRSRHSEKDHMERLNQEIPKELQVL